MVLPNQYDILGIVDKNYEFTRMRVVCQDGHRRMCRIRGKMKKRSWVREGDVVLVSPWDFEFEGKSDIIFRYTSN
jgi:translation initiation factor 1A